MCWDECYFNKMYAFVCNISPATVADGVLGLDGEEEAGGEALDVVGARHEALVGHVGRVEVAVEGEGQVPHAGKEQPTKGR